MIKRSLGWLVAAVLPACSGGSSVIPKDSAVPGQDASPAPTAQVNQVRSAEPRITNPSVSSDDAAELATDDLASGIDIYGQLRAGSSGNFIFSQTSISLALAMLYGGAANNTAAQMATALHFTLPPERLHPAFNALDLALMAQPSDAGTNVFQLSIASSTWVQGGFTFLPSYLDLLAEDYGSGLFVEDFASSPETARSDINTWVSTQTQQMIPQLFDPGTILPSVVLVLANAVYFHGVWQIAFNPTSPNGTFHASAGDVTVPMMSSSVANATLWAGGGWNAASLSYAGGTVSMILLVPDAGTFDTFEQGMTADALAAMLNPAASSVQYSTVSMPRFKFATSSPLNSLLKALGMIDAFDPALADFSGMDGARDLYVGYAIHKAIIAVDETGTTAAAATGVTVQTLALELPALTVDRPFLFFIRHEPTGAILFQGRVVDPSQAQ